ncbi:MAG: phosphate ABC transporter substrate-binding/OmpA family protein [Wenzhouxiangellaceae bacterium]|nr:phosphate ABC transporter substrate-binding/OmpA family protein [Wenzhouxiangellaceae bacterium]
MLISVRWMFLLLMLLASHAVGAQIRMHGSNTVGEELAPALIRGWLERDGYDRIEVRQDAELERTIVGRNGAGQARTVQLHAHGSSTSFRALDAGLADLGMSSRRIRSAEVEQLKFLGKLDRPDNEFVIGIDGLAVIVHPSNPIAALSIDQVRAVFSGKIRNWRELGGNDALVTLYARAENSGTWDSFKSMVLQGAELARSRRFESSSELSDLVSNDPNAIGFIGLPYVRAARALAISSGGEPVLPERFSSATEDYPLSRRLYIYVPDQQLESQAGSLARFAISAAGQKIVDRIGFVGQAVEARRVALPANAPEAYKTFVEGALRASMNFRFKPGYPELDSKSRRDLDRLVGFMKKPENRELEVLLMGFADPSETMKYFSLTLSHDRVDYVAALLSRAGVFVSRVRGFGDALLLAHGTGVQSQAKNRRVEVWLKPARQRSITSK